MSAAELNSEARSSKEVEVIARYTDQPSRIPEEVRGMVEAAMEGEPIQLYALADLDDQMTFSETWVALGPNTLVTAQRENTLVQPVFRDVEEDGRGASRRARSFDPDQVVELNFGTAPFVGPASVASVRTDNGTSLQIAAGLPSGMGLFTLAGAPARPAIGSARANSAATLATPPQYKITSIARGSITAVSERAGLSCTVLTIASNSQENAPVLRLRYTHRQRRAMENVRFILQQQVEGREIQPGGDPHELYGRAVAQPVQDAQAAVSANKMAVLWRLLSYLRPYRAQVIFGMVAASLMTLMSLIPPYVTGRLLDRVVKPLQSGEVSRPDAARTAFIMLGIIGAVYLLREVFAWIRLRTMAVLGEYVAHDLRRDLYSHLQRLSLSYFSSKQTGSIISRVSSDTDRIWDFIAFGVVEVSLSLLMLVGLGGVLLWLDWPLGLIMTLPVPIALWAIFRHGQDMQKLFLRAWRKWSSLTDVLSDTIPGVRVVKAFNREEGEKRRFGRRNSDALGVFNSIHDRWTRFWPGLTLGMHTVVLAVWALAIPRLLGWKPSYMPELSSGEFISFLLYTGMFMYPIEVIGQMARMLNRATSSAHRVFEVLDTRPQIVDIVEPVKLSPLRGRVTFDNVSFGYDGVRQVLSGVTFDAKPGEMIGLVGPSGSGKTTITNLIARFYEPSDGTILIDGVDLRTIDTALFRRQVGMVLQDPFLFHGSVLDNIRYGVPEATVEQVIEAAKAANAHDFICKLAHGYDTVVGERGQTLSGGERQRVSIARAVLCNPSILILDEATSSVDTETERKIQQALDRLIEGRTVFAIAHRLSTLVRATRLLVMTNGRIVEQGTHTELLEKNDGVYRKLHDMQHQLHEMYAV